MTSITSSRAGSAEPVGGISRFQTVANHYRSHPQYTDQPELLTLFSGDAFNPSLESSVTKGSHMVPVLNNLETAVACVGNHDLDFGVLQFRHLKNQCNFPWLLANVLDPGLGENQALGGCDKTVLLEASNGIKVGIVGLGEREWLDTINSLPPNLIYKSANETAKELVPELRAQGAQIIIALTHAREPSDIKLAEKTPPGLIDLILGGHDHFYAHQIINETHILRSGTDFKQLSYIEARRKANDQPGWDFDIIRRDITRALPKDKATIRLVEKLTSSLRSKLEKPIGYTAVPLDGRFTTVRTKESNLGNFVCDLMRHYYDADCTLMASGTVRGDQIYPPGILILKDILNCFPFEDPVVVLRINGKAILEALENSVCLVPALEGRFPQVSNIHFAYNPNLAPGSRVTWTKINGKPLDVDKSYVMATRGYMSRGKDGYDSLLVRSEGGNAEEIVSEENGILISMVLRQYFMSLKVLGKWARWSPSLHRHWGGVHVRLHAGGKVHEPSPLKKGTKHGRTDNVRADAENANTDADGRLVDSDTDDEKDNRYDGLASSVGSVEEQKGREMHIARVFTRRWMDLAGIERRDVGMVGEKTGEWELPHWTKGIAPRVEGRIVVEDGGFGNGAGRNAA
ncbi:MAG: hypothetical protein ASARMPREDX12_005652 [Alectoria sarmentosa]|nr:MAG: hypothetical protein ASARMPREDX12_005652 [Alectoria sarmentosa]